MVNSRLKVNIAQGSSGLKYTKTKTLLSERRVAQNHKKVFKRDLIYISLGIKAS